MGYSALIGLVVFGFSHRGIDGGLIGIDDCSSCFCRGQLSICSVYFTHLVRGNNKRAFDCMKSSISLEKFSKILVILEIEYSQNKILDNLIELYHRMKKL